MCHSIFCKVLSALAALPRSQLQSSFTTSFAKFIDLLPTVRQGLSAFCKGNYRVMFDSLETLAAISSQSYHLRNRMVSPPKMLRISILAMPVWPCYICPLSVLSNQTNLRKAIRERVVVDFFESYTAISLVSSLLIYFERKGESECFIVGDRQIWRARRAYLWTKLWFVLEL